jgi:hypothetical protein
VPPARPGEKDFNLPNLDPEPPLVPLTPLAQAAPPGHTPPLAPAQAQIRPGAPRPAAPTATIAPGGGAPSGEVNPALYLPLAAAWVGTLIALPIGLKMGSPLFATLLAAFGLALGVASLGLALWRGRTWQWWGAASLTAVLAAGSAVFAARSVPVKEDRAAAAAPTEQVVDTYVPDTTYVMPDATKHPLTTSVLSAHPSHIVVLVGEVGTDREEVGKLLNSKEMFQGRVIEIPRSDAGRQTLLDNQLKKSIDSITDPKAVMAVLAKMVAEDVRFKGYVPDDHKTTFEIMIKRGGVFTLGAGKDASLQVHGALLHGKGIDQLADFTRITDSASLKHLAKLREAIRDYSSLFDALAAAGDRPSYLISVEANRDAHEAAFEKLMKRSGRPVFVPRPPPRLFDAVDPADVGGRASAEYELQLPVVYYWRQVGQADREGAEEKSLPPQAKWKKFNPKDKVTWKQLTVENVRGAGLVASFDLAVQVSGGNVVLFRNQNLYLHENRAEVDKLTKNAVRRMNITVPQGDDHASIDRKHPKDPWVGTLNYTALANSFHEKKLTSQLNVSLKSNAAFDAIRKTEGER